MSMLKASPCLINDRLDWNGFHIAGLELFVTLLGGFKPGGFYLGVRLSIKICHQISEQASTVRCCKRANIRFNFLNCARHYRPPEPGEYILPLHSCGR
jgi:hypothetical protein